MTMDGGLVGSGDAVDKARAVSSVMAWKRLRMQWSCPSELLTVGAVSGLDAIHVIDATQEYCAGRHGGRGPGHFVVEDVFPDNLEFRAALQHVSNTAIVNTEDLAIRGPRRRPEA